MGSTGKGHRELPDAVSKTSDSDVQRKYIVFAGLDNSGGYLVYDLKKMLGMFWVLADDADDSAEFFELKDYDFVDEYNVKDNSHERIKWKLDFYHRLFNVERRKEALEAAKDESEKLKKMITDLRDW